MEKKYYDLQDENIVLEDIDEREDETLQLAENTDIEQDQKELVTNEFVEKRALLEKTKIVRQTWSISEIYQKIKEGKLVLDPDYQRRAIWNNDKKTAFIESLYMEIMIPPIYVVEIPSEDILEETKYEVVDGKQRLTAIMDFIKGTWSTMRIFSAERLLQKFVELSKKKPLKCYHLFSISMLLQQTRQNLQNMIFLHGSTVVQKN